MRRRAIHSALRPMPSRWPKPWGCRMRRFWKPLYAITSPRPYRPTRTLAEAQAVILSQRGRQFDPAVVDAFARIPDILWHATAEQVRVQPTPDLRLLTVEAKPDLLTVTLPLAV